MSSASSDATARGAGIAWSRSLLVAAWAVAGFVAAQVVLGAGVSILGMLGLMTEADIRTPLFSAVSAAIIYSLAAAITFGLPMLLKKRFPSRHLLGLTRLPTWTDMLLVPAGFVGYFLLSWLLLTLVSVLFPGFDVNQAQDVGFSNPGGIPGRLLAFMTIVVIAPVAEEILLRGYLLGHVRPRVGFWPAAILVSLVFAVLHFQLNVGIDVFALSLVMCLLREVSGSIWAGTMLHMAKNGLAFYILFVNTGLMG